MLTQSIYKNVYCNRLLNSNTMTLEELKKIAMCYAHDELKDNCSPIEAVVAGAFMSGIDYLQHNPGWISVEEQDIPLGQWVITYAPNEINYSKIDVELLAMDETAEDFGITHWMPLPQPPKKGDD